MYTYFFETRFAYYGKIIELFYYNKVYTVLVSDKLLPNILPIRCRFL